MATWGKQSKNTTSWNKESQNITSWAKTNKTVGINSFLLLETGFYLLLEDGISKLMQEQSNLSGTSWNKLAKS